MDEDVKDYPKVLSLGQKIAYGFGDVGYNFLFDMGQLYLLMYMTDIINIPAAAAGGVFAVARIWDAFADVFAGSSVDNRNAKKGHKFHPFIEWSLLPTALILIANFCVPNFSVSAKLVWEYIAYMGFGLLYSLGNVPYGSMAPSMTKNSEERNQLASWRNIGSNLGLLIANVAFMPIMLMFPTKSVGYTATVTIFAVVGVICVAVMAHFTPENYVIPPKNSGKQGKRSFKDFLKSFKPVFHNKALLILCLANLFSFSAYNTKLAVQFYFAQYVLHDVKIASYSSALSITCSIVAAVVMPSISKKLGKKKTYILGASIWVVSDLIAFFATHTGIQYAIFTAISFFGNGLLTALNWSLASDVVEYGEYRTGVRSEGTIYSCYTFFRKMANALAGLIPGIVLSAVGYVPNHAQTAHALMGIRGIEFLYPVICAALTVLVFCFYPLTEKKYEEIVAELKARKGDK